MEKMSITRALVEKKRLGERIQREVSTFNPMVVLDPHMEAPAGYKSIDDYSKAVVAANDSIRDLCARRCRIVSEIAKSNATTTVEICGERMTVAQAIEKKNFYTQTMRGILSRLQTTYGSATSQFERISAVEKQKADQEFEKFISRDKQIKEDEKDVMRRAIESRHRVQLLDPIGLRETLEKKEAEINEFLTNVDIILTESNSKTEIEI